MSVWEINTGQAGVIITEAKSYDEAFDKGKQWLIDSGCLRMHRDAGTFDNTELSEEEYLNRSISDIRHRRYVSIVE